MATKKEFTIEELEAQYKKTEDAQKVLKAQIEQKKKEEKEIREAQLALEKESRKKEVDEAIAKCKVLIKAYMHDYGIYSYTTDNDNDVFSSKFWNWVW